MNEYWILLDQELERYEMNPEYKSPFPKLRKYQFSYCVEGLPGKRIGIVNDVGRNEAMMLLLEEINKKGYVVTSMAFDSVHAIEIAPHAVSVGL